MILYALYSISIITDKYINNRYKYETILSTFKFSKLMHIIFLFNTTIEL